MKNHRLGEWGVGQTKALFVYDETQYDKERAEIEQDAINEMKLNGFDDVTERNREIFKMDYLEEQRVDAEIQNELNNSTSFNSINIKYY